MFSLGTLEFFRVAKRSAPLIYPGRRSEILQWEGGGISQEDWGKRVLLENRLGRERLKSDKGEEVTEGTAVFEGRLPFAEESENKGGGIPCKRKKTVGASSHVRRKTKGQRSLSWTLSRRGGGDLRENRHISSGPKLRPSRLRGTLFTIYDRQGNEVGEGDEGRGGWGIQGREGRLNGSRSK